MVMRKASFYTTLCLLLVLGLAGCTPTELNEQDLTAYITDQSNGVSQQQQASGFNVTVTYRPTDLLVAQHLGKKAYTQAMVDSLRGHYSQYYYFIIGLSKDNKEALYQMEQGFEAFSDMVRTLAFRMDQYTYLTLPEADTIPTADFIFPRTYGSGTATNIMVVFNRKKVASANWVDVNLQEFGLQTGHLKFRFETGDINSVPRLIFTPATAP